MGTNDLARLEPAVVRDKLIVFIHCLLALPSIKCVVWCMVIPRASHFKNSHQFNSSVMALNGLIAEALAAIPNAIHWRHNRFGDDSLYLNDEVHVSTKGQYALYRSYRGAILAGLKHSYLVSAV